MPSCLKPLGWEQARRGQKVQTADAVVSTLPGRPSPRSKLTYLPIHVPARLLSDWFRRGLIDSPEVRGLPKMCEEGRLKVDPAKENTCIGEMKEEERLC